MDMVSYYNIQPSWHASVILLTPTNRVSPTTFVAIYCHIIFEDKKCVVDSCRFMVCYIASCYHLFCHTWHVHTVTKPQVSKHSNTGVKSVVKADIFLYSYTIDRNMYPSFLSVASLTKYCKWLQNILSYVYHYALYAFVTVPSWWTSPPHQPSVTFMNYSMVLMIHHHGLLPSS